MATAIYRYKFTGFDMESLRSRVPGTVTLGSIGPYMYVDITGDTAYTVELNEAMAHYGYTYDSTNPVSSATIQSVENMSFAPITAKTLSVNTDIILIEDYAASYAKKKVELGKIPGALFGQDYYYTHKNAVETFTGSVTWTNYLRLGLPTSLPAGTYYIQWWAHCAMNNVSYAYQARCQTDDTTNHQTLLAFTSSNTTTETNPFRGSAVSTLTAGYHWIDLDFTPSNSSATMYMIEACIECWRIS